jgi:aminoglycoside phosphotransferase (APT) family kinase protein
VQALNWVAASLEMSSEVIAVRPLAGGSWHATHVVTVREPRSQVRDLVLRRWTRPGWQLEDADFTPQREATALKLIEGSSVPAPRLISVDSDGSSCDVPATLTDLIPGEPAGMKVDLDSFSAQLAETLLAIHALPGGAQSPLPQYRPYHEDLVSTLPPRWSGDPQLWLAAAARIGGTRPPGAASLIHRDYHPGNTLWRDGQLTGVVDWTQASLGPVSVDTAHMRWNLAVRYGVGAAEGFLAQYRRLAQTRGDDQTYWDIATVLDLLPDLQPEDQGNGVWGRLEEYLRSVLEPGEPG